MTREESINKFLTEKLLGKCWHEDFQQVNYGWTCYCGKCGEGTPKGEEENQSLFTPDGFFILWEAMQKREDWQDFDRILHGVHNSKERFFFTLANVQIKNKCINPQTFPILVAEWLGWKEEV